LSVQSTAGGRGCVDLAEVSPCAHGHNHDFTERISLLEVSEGKRIIHLSKHSVYLTFIGFGYIFG